MGWDRRATVAVIAVAVVVIAAAAVLVSNRETPPGLPATADLSEYSEGVYDIVSLPFSIEETTVDDAGSGDMVLIGEIVASGDTDVLREKVRELLSEGKAVAARAGYLIPLLPPDLPYSFETEASVNAVRIDGGVSKCYSGSAQYSDYAVRGAAKWFSDEMGDSRTYFTTGADWHDSVRSVVDHDFGPWGRVTMSTYHGYLGGGSPVYGTASTVIVYGDGGTRPESVSAEYSADDARLSEHGPRGTYYRFGNFSYVMIGYPGGLGGLDGSIYWQEPLGLEYTDRSNSAASRMDMTYDLGNRQGMYQTDITFGVSFMPADDRVPLSELGRVSVDVAGHSGSQTLVLDFTARVPAPR